MHATLTSKPESSEDLLYRTVSVRRGCNKQAPTSASITSISTVTTNNKLSPTSCEVGACPYEGNGKISRGLPQSAPDPHNDAKNDPALSHVFIQPPVVEATNEDDRFASPVNYQSCGKHARHHYAGTSARGLLTVVALSFHAIFEGLAVGLEPVVGSVIYLAAAIATHKLVIAFCVGMELYVAGTSRKTILGYLSVFSMVTPIGIMVGLALGYFKNDSENLGPVPTILQGMAAGTLLYVVFFEVLARERANDKSGLLQLAAILVGFMLMLGLQLASECFLCSITKFLLFFLKFKISKGTLVQPIEMFFHYWI